jgi:hypothetical protein
MMSTKGERPMRPEAGRNTTRASVTFPRELYETVGRIAKEKKVSVAWIVREATELYAAAQASSTRAGGGGKQ